tara:strand:- start:4832 stop:6019 length:1188 start_codon:yes stop_codon:yes gene_type:complete
MDPSSPEGKEKRPSFLWLLVGVGAAAAGIGVMMIAGAKGEAASETTQVANSVPLVETARVETASNTYRVHAPGRLMPREELSLVGEVSGKVVQVNPELKSGGRIDRGAVVLRIDDGDYSAELARAEAGLATARARLEQASAERDRQVRLAEIGASPEKAAEAARATFEDAQAAVKQAEAQIRIAERAVTKTVIRAPFNALVTQEQVSLGTYVSPGQPLATLISADAAEVEAGLPADQVAAVRAAMNAMEGETLPVRAVPNNSSLSSIPLEGYLAEFSPVIDPASRTATVIAVFPDAFSEKNSGKVFASDYVDLLIEGYSETPVWKVPAGAVRQDAFIWVVSEDSELNKAEVDVLDQTGDVTLLHSADLSGGESVLTTVLSEEIQGMKVKADGARS